MKKFIRIMGLALVLTLLCSSIAFAAPRKLADIEGLPEMPDFSAIPSMSTKKDGDTQTLTLSAPLAWLCAIRNWEWIPVTFAEDGVSGTVGIDPSLQIGFAKGSWAAGWLGDDPIWTSNNYGIWVNDGDEDAADRLAAAKEAAAEDHELDSNSYQFHPYEWEWEDPDTGDYYHGDEDPHKVTYVKPEQVIVEEYAQPENGGTWYNVFTGYPQHTYCYDTYALNGYGMAYEGETTDGLKVRYDSHGKLMEVIVTLTGVNFLGSEEAPTKTELYYEFVKAGDYWNDDLGEWVDGKTQYWVLRSIKEYYGQDENGNDIATQVKYSYNGNYDTTLK